MVQATIPVDLRNPGQVFACLGLMEAAEILCNQAHAGFDWTVYPARFVLVANGSRHPIEAALDFIDKAAATELAPVAWVKTGDNRRTQACIFSGEFPAGKGENLSLPVILTGPQDIRFTLSHWADGSSRDSFKLYSGNRSAFKIVGDMQILIRQLLAADQAGVIADPFAAICPMGGSFNFDPRGAWNAIDAGYSPDRLGHSVAASPVVELFAAIGLENSRPVRHSTFEYSYRVWADLLPASLAPCALTSRLPGTQARLFRLPLFRPNPNSRAVTYAEEEYIQ